MPGIIQLFAAALVIAAPAHAEGLAPSHTDETLQRFIDICIGAEAEMQAVSAVAAFHGWSQQRPDNTPDAARQKRQWDAAFPPHAAQAETVNFTLTARDEGLARSCAFELSSLKFSSFERAMRARGFTRHKRDALYTTERKRRVALYCAPRQYRGRDAYLVLLTGIGEPKPGQKTLELRFTAMTPQHGAAHCAPDGTYIPAG